MFLFEKVTIRNFGITKSVKTAETNETFNAYSGLICDVYRI